MNDSLDRFHNLIDYETHLSIPKKKKISLYKKIYFFIIIIIILILLSSFFMTCYQVSSLREIHSTLLFENNKTEKKLISLKEDCALYKKDMDIKSKANEEMRSKHYLIDESKNKRMEIENLKEKVNLMRKRINGYREEDKYLTNEIRAIHLNEQILNNNN